MHKPRDTEIVFKLPTLLPALWRLPGQTPPTEPLLTPDLTIHDLRLLREALRNASISAKSDGWGDSELPSQ